MKKSLLTLALVGALTCFSANAAVEGTFSLGASLGWGHAYNTSTSIDTQWHDSSPTESWRYLDFKANEKNSYGIKLSCEYNFTDWFGLGVGYNFFTGADIKYEDGSTQDYSNHMFDVYARLAYPLDKNGSDVFVKAGPSVNILTTDNGGADSNFGAVLGIGGQWAVNDKISIRAGYDYYFKTADYDEDYVKYESDTGLLYVGVNYNL